MFIRWAPFSARVFCQRLRAYATLFELRSRCHKRVPERHRVGKRRTSGEVGVRKALSRDRRGAYNFANRSPNTPAGSPNFSVGGPATFLPPARSTRTYAESQTGQGTSSTGIPSTDRSGRYRSPRSDRGGAR